MVKAASDQGLAMTAALAAFLYATQKFVGTLPASYFGLKAARRYVEEFRQLKAEDPDSILDQEELPQDSPRLSWAERNTRRFTIYISLFIGAAAAWLGTIGGKLTHNWVGMFLWCMIIGLVLRNLGLVPANLLKRMPTPAASSFSVPSPPSSPPWPKWISACWGSWGSRWWPSSP